MILKLIIHFFFSPLQCNSSGTGRFGCHRSGYRCPVRILLCSSHPPAKQEAEQRCDHTISANATPNGRPIAKRPATTLFQKVPITDRPESIARLIANTARKRAASITVQHQSKVFRRK